MISPRILSTFVRVSVLFSLQISLLSTVIVYRVNWLRSREQASRWDEEYAYLWNEMEWVPNFMDYKMKRWKTLTTGDTAKTLGHTAYAHRQAALWQRMAEYARSHFAMTRKKLEGDTANENDSDGDNSD